MKAKNIIRVAVATAVILSVPLVAMQFTEEVDWNVFDFVIIGTLLMSAGLFFEFVAVRVNPKYRPLIVIGVAAAVFLIWAELAVGVFGSPFAGS